MSAPVLGAPAALTPDLLPQARPTGKDPKEVAKQFEGMLLANMFQQMRKTVHHTDLFGGGSSATGTYEYLLDQAVVNHAMEGGRTWGLSAKIEASLKAAQRK